MARLPSRRRGVFAVFARRSLGEGGHGTIFIACRRGRAEGPDMRSIVRGTSLMDGRKLLQVQKFGRWVLVQYRDTSCLGGRN